MSAEINRMLSGKGFLWAILLGGMGIVLGAPYPKMDKLLQPGSFLALEGTALYSQTASFFLPIIAVLPWSDSFLEEWKGGYLKSCLPRTGRREYVENKILTVALGGFLAWMTAGITVLFCFFVVFFPCEKQGGISPEEVSALFAIMTRGGVIAAILGSLGGLCGAITGSVYMAYGLPFVGYYFCMILYERYFPKSFWIYPKEWIAGSRSWGKNDQGLWLFLLLFLAVSVTVHREILYEKLEEI